MSFEEDYQDVLQNIEFAIIDVYRGHPALLDYDVETVITALMRAYQGEQSGRQIEPPALNPLRQELYEAVKAIAEWRLGRAGSTGPGGLDTPAPITLEEMIACMKRIRKSVQKWNKHGGQRGYLTFVGQFMG